MSNRLSKREFLKGFASIAGSSALMATMDAWGLGLASSLSKPPALTGTVNGKKVIILGAGVGGLSAAYELGKRGYQCRILEARPYAGGRCLTARRGFQLAELGRDAQKCAFDDGLYSNLGAWRIASHHHSVLYYCKAFQIPLETLINTNDSGYVRFEKGDGPLKGKRFRRREVMADMRGYTSEILAKLADQGKLDEMMTTEDVERLLDYLVYEGFLDPKDIAYKGTKERGFITEPGAGVDPGAGVPSKPLAFEELLRSGLGRIFRGVPSYERPYTMFQPVGGMDKIVDAFVGRLEDKITYGVEVQEIDTSNNEVSISYKDLESGELGQQTADFCICTIPPGVLSRIKNNFSADCKTALQKPISAPVGKLALQMNRRFWEEDDGIFGGYSQTDNPEHRTTIYPSNGWLGDKGILYGYYNIGPAAIRPSSLNAQQRAEFGLGIGEKLHPGQFRKHFSGKSLSIAWHLVNYSLGGWEMWTEEGLRKHYPVLLKPQGKTFFTGTHLTHLNGWQAGAIESSWQQIEKLHRMATTGSQPV